MAGVSSTPNGSIAESNLGGAGVALREANPRGFRAPISDLGSGVWQHSAARQLSWASSSAQQNELDNGAYKWRYALIGFVVGDKPHFKQMEQYVHDYWKDDSPPSISLHEKGYFVFYFTCADQRDAVLDMGPYSFNYKPFISRNWSADFDFEEEMLRVIPLWIKLPNLPLNCWSVDSVSRIGSAIGDPIYADPYTTQQDRISFARILVDVDITQPYKDVIHIEVDGGRTILQKLEYEWKPSFCQKCRCFNHSVKIVGNLHNGPW